MSNPDYATPYTLGIRLSEFSQSGLNVFNLHETGYVHWPPKHSLKWNFQGIESPFWHFYYNFDADSTIVSGKKRYSLDSQSLLLIPENIIYDCYGSANFQQLWMHFNSNYPQLGSLKKPISVTVTPTIKTMLFEIRDSIVKGVRGMELFHASQSLLHSSFAQVLKTRKLYWNFNIKLANILNFIQSRITTPPSNTELAKYANMSEGAFIRWFTQYVHMTPGQYSIKLRLQRAANQLAFEDKSIDEIADNCGFTNRNYFSRIFSSHFKQGPSSFRKKFRSRFTI